MIQPCFYRLCIYLPLLLSETCQYCVCFLPLPLCSRRRRRYFLHISACADRFCSKLSLWPHLTTFFCRALFIKHFLCRRPVRGAFNYFCWDAPDPLTVRAIAEFLNEQRKVWFPLPRTSEMGQRPDFCMWVDMAGVFLQTEEHWGFRTQGGSCQNKHIRTLFLSCSAPVVSHLSHSGISWAHRANRNKETLIAHAKKHSSVLQYVSDIMKRGRNMQRKSLISGLIKLLRGIWDVIVSKESLVWIMWFPKPIKLLSAWRVKWSVS